MKGLRLRKSIRVGKGVRLNLSKSGIGVSAGVKGFRVGVGPRGGTIRASIPGTGIGYEVRTKKGKRKDEAPLLDPGLAAQQVPGTARRGYPWLWLASGLVIALITGSAWWLLLSAWGLVILVRRNRR